MITADAHDLQRLQLGLSQYARYTTRSPAAIVAAKAQQLLLGVGTGADRKAGLYGRLADQAPAAGSIEANRRADHFRLGRPDSTSVRWARERAEATLGAGEAGVFRGTTLGQIYTRGKRRGQIGFGRKSKTAVRAIGYTREGAADKGGVLMNRQALLVALAIQRRERSRLASAVQFLPAKYRALLRRYAALKTQGSAIGQVHETIEIENRKGRQLGSLNYAATSNDALAKIFGGVGLYTQAQRAAVSQAINLVVADMAAYTARKQEAVGKAAFSK